MEGYTLLLTASAVECAGAVMLLAVWYVTRDNPAANSLTVLSWVCFFAFIGTGSFLIGARQHLPLAISIFAGNVLVFLGLGMGRLAFAEMNGLPRRYWTLAVPPLLWLALCSIPAFYQDFTARAATSNLFVALASVWMSQIALKYNRYRLQTCLFLGLIYYALTIIFFGNAVMLVTLKPDNLVAALSTQFLFYSFFVYTILICLVMTLTFAMFMELQQKHFRKLARRDPLTGLRTRAAFFESLTRLSQSGDNVSSQVAFVMIDLDHFKRANDTYGHGFGDQVLEAFGAILREVLPPDARSGRLGGEEFAVFLPEHYVADTVDLLETIRIRIRTESATIPPTGHPVTMSAGVLIADKSEHHPEQALAAADKALYRAKANGRDRIEFADAPEAVPLSA